MSRELLVMALAVTGVAVFIIASAGPTWAVTMGYCGATYGYCQKTCRDYYPDIHSDDHKSCMEDCDNKYATCVISVPPAKNELPPNTTNPPPKVAGVPPVNVGNKQPPGGNPPPKLWGGQPPVNVGGINPPPGGTPPPKGVVGTPPVNVGANPGTGSGSGNTIFAVPSGKVPIHGYPKPKGWTGNPPVNMSGTSKNTTGSGSGNKTSAFQGGRGPNPFKITFGGTPPVKYYFGGHGPNPSVDVGTNPTSGSGSGNTVNNSGGTVPLHGYPKPKGWTGNSPVNVSGTNNTLTGSNSGKKIYSVPSGKWKMLNSSAGQGSRSGHR